MTSSADERTEIPNRRGGRLRLRRTFAILLSLYLVVLYPLLRANRYYDDDLKRALIGRAGWDSNGRPLTTLLMKLMQAYDHALVDISPLPQLIAIVLLAWAGVLLARRYAIRSPWLAALVTLPLGAQPFFMENLSYKFDALSMGLAILLALVPIVSLGNTRRHWWWGVAAIFASLSLYQPAVCVLLVFTLLDWAIGTLAMRSPRELARQWLRQMGQAVTGMAIYQGLIGIHIHGWVQKNAQLLGSPGELAQIGHNFIHFYGFVVTGFNSQWWNYFALPVAILLGLPTIIGLRYAVAQVPSSTSRSLRLMLGAIAFVLPLAALAAALGPMLLLSMPLVVPRVMMGMGGLLAAGLILAQAAFREWRRSERWSLALSGMFTVGMLVFASAYGNALGEQRAYEERLGGRIADDMAAMEYTQSVAYYLVDGSAGLAPVTAHVAEQFPLMHALILPYLSADDDFNTGNFLKFYIPRIKDLRRHPELATAARERALLAQACQLPVFRVAHGYWLYRVGDTAVIAFGDARRRRCGPGA